MRHALCASVVLSAVLATVGCESPVTTPAAPATPPGPTTLSPAGPAEAATAALSGTLMAPAGIIATGGGNIIAPGGGNIIAPGGGNIIAPGGGNIIAPGGGNFAGWGVLDVESDAVEEQPLEGTLIYLADLAGQPFDEIEPAVTDAAGAYAFEDLPEGVPFRLIASVETEDGQPAVLETLAEAGEGADLNLASTLATAHVTDQPGEAIGALDREAFRALVAETRQNLRQSDLPTDMGDRQAFKARMQAMAERLSPLKSRLESVRGRLREALASRAEQRAKLVERFKRRPVLEQVQHTFFLPQDLNARAYPVAIELRRRGTGEAVASFTFSSPGERLSAKVVEHRPFSVWSKRKFDFKYQANGFLRVPRGTQGEVPIRLRPRP